MPAKRSEIILKVDPRPDNRMMRELTTIAWDEPAASSLDYQSVFANSCVHVGAYAGDNLVGYVNVAWDGGVHGFLLDTTVHPDHRHQGLGRKLVLAACAQARAKGVQWMHVDYVRDHEAFYAACGFQNSSAGVMKLGDAKNANTGA